MKVFIFLFMICVLQINAQTKGFGIILGEELTAHFVKFNYGGQFFLLKDPNFFTISYHHTFDLYRYVMPLRTESEHFKTLSFDYDQLMTETLNPPYFFLSTYKISFYTRYGLHFTHGERIEEHSGTYRSFAFDDLGLKLGLSLKFFQDNYKQQDISVNLLLNKDFYRIQIFYCYNYFMHGKMF